MEVKIPIGDVFDKHTILQLKQENCHLDDTEKLKHITEEYKYINDVIDGILSEKGNDEIQHLTKQLYDVNKILWCIEDKLREHERNQTFDFEFIKLARDVYRQNDIRSRIKKKINLMFHSEFVEEKIY